VDAAVPGGDGDLDDVRESMVSPKRWSTGSRTSCNGGERWLELGVAAVVFWTCRRSAKRGDLGGQRSYQMFRLKRRFWWRGAWSRGALRHAESLTGVRVLRQRDSDADVPVVLVYKRSQKDVREMRVVKAMGKVQNV
jgi:hypothetical protein